MSIREKNIHYNYYGFVELLKNCKIKLNQFFTFCCFYLQKIEEILII